MNRSAGAGKACGRRISDQLNRREIFATDLPHRAIAVYLYLKDRADREKLCYPAIGTIANELKISKSTVKRAISDLERDGFIRKKQRWRENGGRSSLLFEIIK
ncbi:MAG: helix-turn-helix domain-containing protein [Lachnospiraceae bacterium]|nr:helix-turn-helix domain-containing protein [Lachnospiraceae bacterium]